MTIIFLVGAMDPSALAAMCDRAAHLLDGDEPPMICDVRGLEHPDAATIEVLARLQLVAGRAGCRIELRGACDELCELIELAGLAEVLTTRLES